MEEDAADLIFGRRPVLELLRSGRPVNRIYVLAGGQGIPRELFTVAGERAIPVVRGDRARLDRLCRGGNHQGVAAQTAAREFASLQEVLEAAAASDRRPLLLALDGIQDPHNLGALLRTGEAAGVQGVLVSARGSCGLTGAVSRAAAGADQYLPVARVERLDQTLSDLRSAGFEVVGADLEGARDYHHVDLRGPVVLVLGAEGRGLSPAVRRSLTQRARIPMVGRVESLNVSVSGAILLYEAVRQRAGSGPGQEN